MCLDTPHSHGLEYAAARVCDSVRLHEPHQRSIWKRSLVLQLLVNLEKFRGVEFLSIEGQVHILKSGCPHCQAP